MKTITVFGAGKVAPKAIEYLANNHKVIFTDRDEKQIESTYDAIDSSLHKNIDSVVGELSDSADNLTKASDAIISLLPAKFHYFLAKKAYEFDTHFLSTSYLSPEMKSLDFHAKSKKLLFLNEIGLDPGIDHMSAMQLIDKIKDMGHTITGFESDCGGIPSKSDVNPLHYLSSWRIAGPLEAIQGEAQFLRDDNIISVPKGELSKHVKGWHFDEIKSNVESYPNRNSLPYAELYGLEPSKLNKFMRGTLRYKGWVALMDGFEKAGFFSKDIVNHMSFLDHIKSFSGANNSKEEVLVHRSGFDKDTYKAFSWLGLFEPIQMDNISPFDKLVSIMDDKVQYTTNSPSDLVIMKHFIYHTDGFKNYKTTATMVYEGLSHVETAMSLTVGLPVAMGAELLLDGKLEGFTGVQIPVSKNIYNPILAKLNEKKVSFDERTDIL